MAAGWGCSTLQLVVGQWLAKTTDSQFKLLICFPYSAIIS